jgi:DNA (cytosine-5)-methyltransferase 1
MATVTDPEDTLSSPTHKIAALFAGIGGIELGFKQALGDDVETGLFCESWDPAIRVLAARFPGIEIQPDVRELMSIPQDTTLVTAGFPCTDLSQAGRKAGIEGVNSGLVKHVFAVLNKAKASGYLPSLMIENVPNMLALNKGKAMSYLVQEIEQLGYRWAYRVVDSRFTGVPQRRRRVIMLASRDFDPRSVLFADDAGPRDEIDYKTDAFGFYWTEGRLGLGWAQDAVPTLKGGSTVGIPSPPAIWVPDAPIERRLVKPRVEDAEVMQGFDKGWTDIEFGTKRRNGPRWKLVGNAVTARVSEWVARRINEPGDPGCLYTPWRHMGKAWPTAAWGEGGKVYAVLDLSEFPEQQAYTHLREVVDVEAAEPLSARAAAGFCKRLYAGNLGRYPGFREDVLAYTNWINSDSERLVVA